MENMSDISKVNLSSQDASIDSIQHLFDTISELSFSNHQYLTEIRNLQDVNKEYYTKICGLQLRLVESLKISQMYQQAISVFYFNISKLGLAVNLHDCVNMISDTLKQLFNLTQISIYFRSLGGKYTVNTKLSEFFNTQCETTTYLDGKLLINSLYEMNIHNLIKCNIEQLKYIPITSKYAYASVVQSSSDPILGIIFERNHELSLYETVLFDYLTKSYAAVLQLKRNMMEATIISNSWMKNYRYAIKASFTDELTKIPNSAALSDKITGLRSEYIIMFLDIDNFKYINDTFGHDAGDDVLIWFAEQLNQQCNSLGGEAYRKGGDEFVAIFQGSQELLEIIKNNIEVFMQTVRNKKFNFVRTLDNFNDSNNPTQVREEHSITCSIGICYNNGNLTFEQAKAKADEAMYASKRQGKNSVTLVNL